MENFVKLHIFAKKEQNSKGVELIYYGEYCIIAP